MEKLQKEALQVTKEILVKFIESGRVSPATFSEVFPSVYQTVCRTISCPMSAPGAPSGKRDRETHD